MFRTMCDFELLQEYLVKIANRSRLGGYSRRDVPGVVELQRVGMGAALLWHPMKSGFGLHLRCSLGPENRFNLLLCGAEIEAAPHAAFNAL